MNPPSSVKALALFVVTPSGIVEHPLPAEGRLTIGRGEGNSVRIDDASVSRRHAALDIGETLAIEDLGGSNGTYVQRASDAGGLGSTMNLRPIHRERSEIGLGDRVVLGAVQLFVRRVRPKARGGHPGDAEHVVRDERMIELYAQAERVAGSRINVLLHGETGVGKEVIAHRLHVSSPRRDGPFVAVNCAALPESLLEAELFGAEKGSYTGATQSRPGLFESAERGTLFLDEVGELPLGTQAKLLRALEDRKVLRVGARTPRSVDVRFVAATNRDLKLAADQGLFRADLFFRLAAVILEIPPLRERKSEIEPLARLLLDRACRELERPGLEFSRDALDALVAYAWPGNVRELKNAVDHAAVLSLGSPIVRESLPAAVVAAAAEAPLVADIPATDPLAFKEQVEKLDRQRILAALEECHGNQTRAASLLGVSRRTLINRLDEYDIGRPRKR